MSYIACVWVSETTLWCSLHFYVGSEELNSDCQTYSVNTMNISPAPMCPLTWKLNYFIWTLWNVSSANRNLLSLPHCPSPLWGSDGRWLFLYPNASGFSSATLGCLSGSWPSQRGLLSLLYSAWGLATFQTILSSRDSFQAFLYLSWLELYDSKMRCLWLVNPAQWQGSPSNLSVMVFERRLMTQGWSVRDSANLH